MNKITLFVFACLSSQQTILTSAKEQFLANHPAPQEIQTVLDQLEQNKRTLRTLADNALQNYRESFAEFLAANLQPSHQLTECPTKELLETFKALCDKEIAYTELKELSKPEHRAKIEDNIIATRLIFAYLNYRAIHELLLKINEKIYDLSSYHFNPQTLELLAQNERDTREYEQDFLKTVSLNTAQSNY